MKVEGNNIKIHIGDIGETDDWKEKEGPTPKPGITSLREWDKRLLRRYKPIYSPVSKNCSFCAFGPCDLNLNRKGSCGIDLTTQTAREALLSAVTGASAHSAHGRHVLDFLIKKHGKYAKINVAENTEVEAPLTRLIIGTRVRNLNDLLKALNYIEEQITGLLACLTAGQESSDIDFNSKTLHAGMLDLLAMEISDLVQISFFGFPMGDPNSPLVDIGFGVVNQSKPIILCIGHNIVHGTEIVDYAKNNKHDVEIAGICCTAHDLARHNKSTKVIGPLSYQLPYVRSGIADVIVTDEQCVRLDTIENAAKLGIPVIATSDKNAGGLEDFSDENPDIVVKRLVYGEIKGAYIPDVKKAGEIAVKTAIQLHGKRRMGRIDYIRESEKCTACGLCVQACPIGNNVKEIITGIKEKKNLSRELLDDINSCVFCGRCESWCGKKIPIVSIFSEILREKLSNQKSRMRSGRGAIQDNEIRNVGAPIVFGEIPGIIAPVGCPVYPRGGKELVEIVEEFLKRRYIVTTSGCAAMTLGIEGNLYEKYGAEFNSGNLINVGSCIANSHIAGAAIKVANIFAKRPLRANFEEIADYILNRVGAVGIVWGAMSQKAFSIASGFNRLGVPVILGPTGKKYRRDLLSDENTNWNVYDTRGKGSYNTGPVPEHLFYTAKTKEELMTLAAKLVIRASDGVKGRQIKLAHYIDLNEKFYGKLPDDLHKFIRTNNDIPITRKTEILEILKEKGWKSVEKIPDPTILERLSGGSKR